MGVGVWQAKLAIHTPFVPQSVPHASSERATRFDNCSERVSLLARRGKFGQQAAWLSF